MRKVEFVLARHSSVCRIENLDYLEQAVVQAIARLTGYSLVWARAYKDMYAEPYLVVKRRGCTEIDMIWVRLAVDELAKLLLDILSGISIEEAFIKATNAEEYGYFRLNYRWGCRSNGIEMEAIALKPEVAVAALSSYTRALPPCP